MSNEISTKSKNNLISFVKLGLKTYFASAAVVGLGAGYLWPSTAQQDLDTLTFKRPTNVFDYATSIVNIPFTTTGAFIRTAVDSNSTPPSPNP